MNELKNLLRKNLIKFKEEHHPDHYTVEFYITNFDKTTRHYNITVDLESSKIMHYIKSKDNKNLIEINNCDGKLLFLKNKIVMKL